MSENNDDDSINAIRKSDTLVEDEGEKIFTLIEDEMKEKISPL
jgi:hypothetical protein